MSDLHELLENLHRHRGICDQFRHMAVTCMLNTFSPQSCSADSVDLNIQLNFIKITVWDKLLYMKELDSKLLECCSNVDITKEIKETTLWQPRVYEALNQIAEFTKRRYARKKVTGMRVHVMLVVLWTLVFLHR